MPLHSVNHSSPGFMSSQVADPEFPEYPLLSGISSPARKEILRLSETRKVAAKTLLIQSGDKAENLFLLSSGSAKYYRISHSGDEHLLRWLVSGDVFGLATIIKNPPPYMGTVQAIDECEAHTWTHNEIRKLSRTYPQLAENALRIALEYLASFTERHKNLLTKTAEQRIAGTLLNLGEKTGRRYSGGVQVDITNEQLGNLSDVGVFTASRILTKWERSGAIGKLRGRVFIKAPEKLMLDLDP